MKKMNLVLGGAGFLGNNTVRELLRQGESVRASVRNPNYQEPFEHLECEVVYADILDKQSLTKALQDVDIVYNCAAVYKSWAKDPQKEIIDVNVEGTKNVVNAAIDAKVRRLVHVSSGMVLAKDRPPIREESGWNEISTDPYTISKIESEKIAWKLVQEKNLEMIAILPAGMIGPNSFGHVPPAMEFYYNLMENKIPFDPCFYFNIVDVRDVAKWMVFAAKQAPDRARYILGPDQPITTTDIYQLAHALFPHVKIPPKRSRAFLMTIATIMELISKINGRKPLLQRSLIRQFSMPNYCFDTTKAKKELGFAPRSSMETIEEFLRSIGMPKR